jgi:hypothetical protein
MAMHVAVIACDLKHEPVATVDGLDVGDAAVIDGIVRAVLLLGSYGLPPEAAVVVVRDGCVTRNVHSQELAGLHRSIIEAAMSATRSWRQATEPR